MGIDHAHRKRREDQALEYLIPDHFGTTCGDVLHIGDSALDAGIEFSADIHHPIEFAQCIDTRVPGGQSHQRTPYSGTRGECNPLQYVTMQLCCDAPGKIQVLAKQDPIRSVGGVQPIKGLRIEVGENVDALHDMTADRQLDDTFARHGSAGVRGAVRRVPIAQQRDLPGEPLEFIGVQYRLAMGHTQVTVHPGQQHVTVSLTAPRILRGLGIEETGADVPGVSLPR